MICLKAVQVRVEEFLNLRLVTALQIASVLVLLTSGIFGYFILSTNGQFWSRLQEFIPLKLNPEAWSTAIQATWISISILIAGCLYFLSHGFNKRLRGSDIKGSGEARANAVTRGLVIGMMLMALAQTIYLMRYGSWTRVRGGDPSYQEYLTADHLPLFAGYPLIASSVQGQGYGAAVVPAAKFYQYAGSTGTTTCFYPIRGDGEKASNVLLPFYLSTQVICSADWQSGFASVDPKTCNPQGAVIGLHDNPVCALATNPASGIADLLELNRSLKILELSSNGIAMKVVLPRAAVLVTPYPNVPGWRVEINGRPAQISEINGGMIGVLVPRGRHFVRIGFYSSRIASGYLVMFMTFGLLGGLALHQWVRRRPWVRRRVLIPVGIYLIALLCGYAGYRFWHNGFEQRVQAKILLNNSYAGLLKLQKQRWKAIGLEAPTQENGR